MLTYQSAVIASPVRGVAIHFYLNVNFVIYCFGLSCLSPRNDVLPVVLPTSPNIYPRNDSKLVVLPTSPNIYPRNDSKLVVLPASPNIYPRNDSKLVVSPDNPNTFTPAVIQRALARRISLTYEKFLFTTHYSLFTIHYSLVNRFY